MSDPSLIRPPDGGLPNPEWSYKAPRRSSGMWVLIGCLAVVLVAAAALAAVVVLRRARSDTHDVVVTMTLRRDGFSTTSKGTCYGSGGYDDIDAGTQVKIKDAKGAVIAIGALGVGSPTNGGCLFFGTVPAVHLSSLMQVNVSHRGDFAVTHDELVAEDYRVDLSLGS